MWRSILAVVLLPALTAAQTPADNGPQQPAPLTRLPESAPTALPKYEQFAAYDAIRQGTAEEVAIQCWRADFVTVPKSPVSGIVPLNLELQPAEGLAVSNVEYPKPFKRKVRFQSQSIPLAESPLIRFKVHADRKASPGAHVLIGKITFQAIGTNSVPGPVQEMEVQIPIRVVEHNARVSRSNIFPARGLDGPLSPALIVLMIVLAPVVIPLWFLACTIGGQDCRC